MGYGNDEKKSRIMRVGYGCAGSSLFTHTHIIVHNIYIIYYYYMCVRILTYILRGWICNILFRFEFYSRSCREEENKYKPACEYVYVKYYTNNIKYDVLAYTHPSINLSQYQ